jgi:hypothetical protein
MKGHRTRTRVSGYRIAATVMVRQRPRSTGDATDGDDRDCCDGDKSPGSLCHGLDIGIADSVLYRWVCSSHRCGPPRRVASGLCDGDWSFGAVEGSGSPDFDFAVLVFVDVPVAVVDEVVVEVAEVDAAAGFGVAASAVVVDVVDFAAIERFAAAGSAA